MPAVRTMLPVEGEGLAVASDRPEDNEVNREIAVALLEAVGLKIAAAAAGIEAVVRARAQRHDRALTAKVFDDERRACAAAGMNDFVAKPVEAHELDACVLNWLEAAPA